MVQKDCRVPQQVKGLATKPGNLSSVLGIHVVEGRRELGPASCPPPATRTQKLINKCNLSSKPSTATGEVSGQGRLQETLHERKREDCYSPHALTRLHTPSHATCEFRVDSQSGIRPIDPVFLHCKIESLQGGVGC